MKFLITLLLSLLSFFGFAQKVSSTVKDAFKYDDVELLLSELKGQKATLNDCFDIEGTAYSLFALSIRMEKPKIFNALIANKADLNKVCSDKPSNVCC